MSPGFSHGQDAHATGFDPNEVPRAMFSTEQLLLQPASPSKTNVGLSRTGNIIHGPDGAIRITDQGAVPVHVADLYQPRLSAPPIGSARNFIEHRWRVVNLGSSIAALIRNQPLDGRAHPDFGGSAIRSQFLQPPVLVGAHTLPRLLHRLLRPVADILQIRRKRGLQRLHVHYALRSFGLRRKVVIYHEKQGGQNRNDGNNSQDLNECDSLFQTIGTTIKTRPHPRANQFVEVTTVDVRTPRNLNVVIGMLPAMFVNEAFVTTIAPGVSAPMIDAI